MMEDDMETYLTYDDIISKTFDDYQHDSQRLDTVDDMETALAPLGIESMRGRCVS